MNRYTVTVILLIGVTCSVVRAGSVEQTVQAILQRTDVHGGLVVHVRCGDGTLTTALRAGDGYTVQGIDTDAAIIEQARKQVRSVSQYGPVSIGYWDGRNLPYADNLVNLLVVSRPASVVRDERLRVLCPAGVAVTLGPDREILDVLRKPRSDQIDGWPHYLHGPDNNAVAQDSVVGPPQHLQWSSGPASARSHEINSSLAAMVSAGGRLFYIWDDGPIGLADKRFPPRWSLIARDAFNGTQLWKRPMPDWGWRQWHAASRWDDPRARAKMLRHSPATVPRRLVADGDRLYVTLGYQAPVSVLDATTGQVLNEFKQTAWTDEILLDNGILILRVRIPDSPPDTDVWDVMPYKQRGRVMVVDTQSGRRLWQSESDQMAPLTLATRNGRVFYSNYDQVVCLDRASGQESWRSEHVQSVIGHRGTCGTLVAQDNVVLYANTPASEKNYFGQIHAFAAETGKLLWSGPAYAGPGVANPPDLFVIDNLVWLGETRLPVDNSQTTTRRQGFDPVTGKVVREVVVPRLTSPGHHFRCYRSKATERYLLLPKRGAEFLDLLGKNHMRHDWLRAPCIYGMLPANGLLYVAPHQCVCYPGVQLNGFRALAPGKSRVQGQASRADKSPESDERVRFVQGPAYGSDLLQSSADSLQPSADWPTYRRDAKRSGSAGTSLPDRLRRRWQVAIGSKITPPVVADGRLFVAEKDLHVIRALDIDSGKVLWSYSAGGRVDSPPTIHGSLVLFGAADGWVYCLRALDGAEVWRFQAAPQDRRITASGQVESVWPVHGSVLIQDDASPSPPRAIAYVTAGRSSFLDGGIYVYGLDPATGKVLYQTRLIGPRPDVFHDTGMAGYMDGAKSDILVSDGADVYMFQERFKADLTRIEAPMQKMGKEGGGYRIFSASPERGADGRRLIATSGFLDDTYHEGTYWTYSRRWAGWDRKMRTVSSYGQLLVFDERTVYGVHVFTDNIRVRRGFTPGEKGYRLFARDHDADKDRWSIFVPVRIRAMVIAGETLFISGPPDIVPADDPLAAIEGRRGAVLWAVSSSDGKKLTEIDHLDASPAFDGLIAAAGCLYLSTTDGHVVCFGAQ